jgi:DNA-directed RNA polymerase specialized sigma24 family protein
MYGVAHRILQDPHPAEDAVQQALLAAWRQLPTLRDPDRVEAWLHRLLVHACFAELRRERRWRPQLHVLGALEPAEPDSTLPVVVRAGKSITLHDWAYYAGTPQSVVDEQRAIVDSIAFQ